MPSGSPHVVIVGAGIIGAAAAYFLGQAGAEVTIVEGDAPSAGATGASDGAVSVASKRPGLMMGIAQRARALYGQLADEGLLAGIYHRRPTYLVARSERELELIAGQDEALRLAGEDTTLLSIAALREAVPGLGVGIRGALAVPGDGHAIGYEIAHRLLSRSRARILRNAPVREITLRGGRAVGVETVTGPIAADAVLVAAGMGSGELIGMAGALVPRKGQMAITDRAVLSGPPIGGHLMSATYLETKRRLPRGETHVGLVVDPLMTGQFLIGSSREDNVSDRSTTLEIISRILAEALELYPPLGQRRIIRTFAGIRTATQDGLPIVGRHGTVDGLTVATGFEGDGICLGPLMGSAASDIVLGREPDIDVSRLSPARLRLNETVQ